jgi:competence protein ComEC
MSERGWVLPCAATAFGLGALFFGDRLGRTAGVGVAAGGLVVLGAVTARALRAQRRVDRADALLRASGLLPRDPEATLSERDRVLRAAGIDPGGVPRDDGQVGTASAIGPAATLAALVALWLLGAGWAAVRAPPVDLLKVLDGRWVTFEGTATSDVRELELGWSLEVSVRRLLLLGQRPIQVDMSTRLWMQGRARPPSVQPGEGMEGAGTLHAVDPREGGFAEYLRDRGLAGTVSVDRIEASGRPAGPVLRLANAARDALRQGVHASLPSREAGLLLGLAIGDTSAMHPEVEEDFRASGLGHLLAVSGANVAMFLAPLLALAAGMRASWATRLLVGLAGVVFFALLTRWEPSVLRASAMAGLALAGAFAGRPRSSAPLLGGAVLLLLIGDPWLARSVGFQLSVAATAGIVALAGPLAARLWWLPRPVALATAATLGAQAAVTPLLLVRFGVVPTATLFANLLAFPAVPPSLFGGLMAAGVAHLWQPAGRLVGAASSLPLSYLEAVADRMARAPLPQVVSEGPALPALVAVLTVVAVWRVRRGRRPIGILLALLLTGAFLWPVAGRAGPPANLTVTFLDVGQGDAAVVRTPDGATVVIDAGPEEQEVARALARLGVRRIDLAVVSHAHADHVRGFPAIFARFPVALLLEPGCPEDDSPAYLQMLESARSEEIPIRNPRGGERLEVGSLTLEVLGPDVCSSEEPNDNSVVLLVHPAANTDPGSSVLFTGDAEEPAQRDLLADGDPVTAAVLKVPHQGGATSTEEFFDAVGAQVAVVSVGPNEYGHPVPWVLAALRRTGALVLRTDQSGDVAVQFDARGVLVESAR